MRVILIIIVTVAHFSLTAQFQNIKIPIPKKATYYYSQVEPSIYINPNNTNEVIAGSVLNDYYFSVDGGINWTSKSIKSKKSGVHGDPCMLIDDEGNYYYFHLSNVDGETLVGGIVCQRSKTIKGKFNKEGHTIINGKFHDKEWVAFDKDNNQIYMTWTQFDEYDSKDPEKRSNILFSKSKDFGMTWTDPIDISSNDGDCLDDDFTAEGAVPTVGPNGEIYVCWALKSKIYFNYSLDYGVTWLDQEIEIGNQIEGWALDIPGIYRCNGMPVTICDISESPYKGTIYVNWADQRNGKTNTDIWLKKSSDGGKTWSSDIRVNTDDSQHHQFLTWMTIDQSTGYLYIVYYDRREHQDNKTDVYLSVSKDGGDSFKDYKISEKPFLPNDEVFFGDYTNISAHNGVVRPIWSHLDDIVISLYTAIINQETLK
tara:strand:+ start:968 stop:2248 length:1281 start_codon:yes stop_codon:yes gene_type:complete